MDKCKVCEKEEQVQDEVCGTCITKMMIGLHIILDGTVDQFISVLIELSGDEEEGPNIARFILSEFTNFLDMMIEHGNDKEWMENAIKEGGDKAEEMMAKVDNLLEQMKARLSGERPN